MSKSKQVKLENIPIRKPRGRPEGSTLLQLTDETLEQIKGLARIQCTQKEAAAVLGVHRETFINFLDTHEKARTVWEDGKENGKASLRRYQFKMAEKNPTMAIWLGKNWIDQTDKTESNVTTTNVSVNIEGQLSPSSEWLEGLLGDGTEAKDKGSRHH